jgi:beta-glucosidase
MIRRPLKPLALFAAILCAGFSLRLVAGGAAGQTAPDSAVEARVDALIQKMTPEEKIDLLSGRRDGFHTLAIDRLGIPSLQMADGPMGVRNYGPSTAYPAGIALAATWDTAMAHRIGASMGQDARARGVNILLAPAINIYRISVNGRNFEYYGEDPYLAGQTAASFIQGVQSEDVIATVKHFAMNNQEYQRNTISAEVDERTMHEIYLPAFKAAVQQGKVWAVMASYNRINGTYATASKMLLADILKQDWGFRGFVISDWGAAHDGVADAFAGLDLEMPNGAYMNQRTLLPAIQSGQIPQSLIDDKVRRILRAAVSMGFLDHPQQSDQPLYSGESSDTALAGAREGIVLLRNNDHVLPLDREHIHSIAVFGPNANPAVPVAGGSAGVVPFRATSVLEALTGVSGGRIRVDYIPFEARDVVSVVARSQFQADEAGAPGLNGEYFADPGFSGAPARARRERQISFPRFNDIFGQPTPNGISARWRGFIAPEGAGDYQFLLRSNRGVRLTVDGKSVVDQWDNLTQNDFSATLHLDGSHAVPIQLEFHSPSAAGSLTFGWGAKPSDTFPAESALAAKADVAIVCAGFNPQSEGEGSDRTFALPQGQSELIRAVARANPRTIVIINSGGGVDMSDWLDASAAVLEAWYTGQESGRAITDILFGDVNPSGKLPASFERKFDDSPAAANYPGADGKVVYKEGIFIGYRYYDQASVKPLFPFGFGLSYTTFTYSGLQVRKDGPNVRAIFSVKNTGSRAGDEIAEVYVQEMHPKVPRPVKELKGYARIELNPGEEKEVRVDLDRSAFEYYDVTSHAWALNPGEFHIVVGASSADIRLTAPVTLP